jgi:adenylate cyclase
LASDPLSSYAYAIYGMTCMLAGRRAEGIEISRRAVELDPDSYMARAILQFVLHAAGNLKSQSRLGSRH